MWSGPIIECLERHVELQPVPDNAAVDALWAGHPAIIDQFIEFGDANANVFSGLDPRETAWGKRKRKTTDRVPDHRAVSAVRDRNLPDSQLL